MGMYALMGVMDNIESDKRERLRREGRSDAEIEREVNEKWKKHTVGSTKLTLKLLRKFFGG
jgi:hypothetical protein